MENFTVAFLATGRVLLTVAGGLCAVLLAAAVLIGAALVISAAFDWFTRAAARRWDRKQRKPEGRIGRAIYANGKRHTSGI